MKARDIHDMSLEDQKSYGSLPFYPRFWPERLSCQFSYYGKKAQGIFVCDMSDLFGIGIPERWTEQVMQLIGAYPQHRFYLLTKQPQNLIKFAPFPDNCFVGVSVTDMPMLNTAINTLPFIKAKVKYLSFEPLLSWECPNPELSFVFEDSGIKWVIIGALTSKSYSKLAATYPDNVDRIMKWGKSWTLQPKIEWVREIVSACDKASIPVFLKDSLKPLFVQCRQVPNIDWWGNCFGLRQEMPID